MSDTKQQDGKQRRADFESFTVEFGDDHNCNIVVGTIAERMRGAWKNSNVYSRGAGTRIGERMAGMPDVPGMRLTLKPHPSHPGCSLCVIHDPLTDDSELVDRVSQGMSRARLHGKGEKVKGHPDTEKELNADKTKTLVIELRRLAKEGSCWMHKGEFPDPEKLQGRELYDPMDQTSQMKPKYADQVHEWKQQLEKAL